MIIIKAIHGADVTEEMILRLSPRAKEKISKKGSDRARRSTMLGEIVLMSLFSDLGIEDSEIILGKHGKPRLKERDDIAYNISHSGDIALGAIVSGEMSDIGIDIEYIDTEKGRREGIAKRFFTERERDSITHSEDSLSEFYRIWTRKESYIKYTGEGMSRPLPSFDVTEELSDADITSGVAVAPDGKRYAYSICLDKSTKTEIPNIIFIK